MAPHAVLVVDQDPLPRRAIVRGVRLAGAVALEADSPARALELGAERRPPLMLVDPRLSPERGARRGLELLCEGRGLPMDVAVVAGASDPSTISAHAPGDRSWCWTSRRCRSRSQRLRCSATSGGRSDCRDERAGPFEDVGAGTLLLDEIGDMALAVQPKLLRVLEARTVQRVGSSRPRPVRGRIVAATHRCLERECDEGRFRRDLLYRLDAVRIDVPPLRERAGSCVSGRPHSSRP